MLGAVRLGERLVARSPGADHERIAIGTPPPRPGGRRPGAPAGPQITRAARDGDPLSLELVGDIGEWLGVGLAGLAAALDPSCIVIGGGLSDARELLLEPARAVFTKSLTGRGHRGEPEIVIASLGADAGFIGAATMAGSAARRARRGRRLHSRRSGGRSLFGYQSRKALPADTP